MAPEQKQAETESTYDPMPGDRPHACHCLNIAGIPVEWIIYEDHHGFCLETTNAYGDGSVVNVTFCPWCGERLVLPEHEAALNWAGRANREGIRVAPPHP